MVRWFLVLALVGCGRLGFAPIGDAGDDGTPVMHCAQWGPFGAPTRVPELSTVWDDWSPAFAADDTIVFTSDWSANNEFAIGQRRRSTPSDPFSATIRLPKPVNTETLHPSVTPDGDALYFTMRNVTSGNNNIAFATRVDATTFTMPQNLASLVSTNYNHQPHISSDQLRLYYTSNNLIPADGGTTELVFTSRADIRSQFAPPMVMIDLDSPLNDSAPTLSRDELEIFWASDRAGGLGALDLYRATRNTTTDEFAGIEHLTTLSTTRDDMGPELSADGSTLYYNRDTDQAGGQNSDVWYATRPCLAMAR